jgi:hypothetical protein
MKTVNEIVGEIVDLAQKVKNPDPVSRIYSVYAEVGREVMEVMVWMREKERDTNGDQ